VLWPKGKLSVETGQTQGDRAIFTMDSVSGEMPCLPYFHNHPKTSAFTVGVLEVDTRRPYAILTV
jgi:hypothetical protein